MPLLTDQERETLTDKQQHELFVSRANARKAQFMQDPAKVKQWEDSIRDTLDEIERELDADDETPSDQSPTS